MATFCGSEVSLWTPEDVVAWMKSINIDPGIIDIFFSNDISGSILLQLQPEDLKELNIQSFGKRHTLMNSIRQLRDVTNISNQSQTSQTDLSRSAYSSNNNSTPSSAPTPPIIAVSNCDSNSSSPFREDGSDSSSRSHRRHRHRRHRRPQVIRLEDMPSIVAIEQSFPRLHSCSKGENCRKWQKQQLKMQRLAKDLPYETINGQTVVTGDPGNPETAPNLLNLHPPNAVGIGQDQTVDNRRCGSQTAVAGDDGIYETAPNILNSHSSNEAPLPSADSIGPSRLSERKLTGLQPLDPQETVRQFVDDQRLSVLQPADHPVTPPTENFTNPPADTFSENLRSLPKLQIPGKSGDSNALINQPAQNNLTPLIVPDKTPLKSAPPQHANSDARPETERSVYGPIPSPANFYREDPNYGLVSAYPETDVPYIDIPFMDYNPVARGTSQSVPPNMKYGENDAPTTSQDLSQFILRETEGCRKMSPQSPAALNKSSERRFLSPIETPEDLQREPRSAKCREPPFMFGNHDVNHSGWMKKRRTRLLRHEWNDHHFTLRGTQLAMYADEQAAQRDSKALEYVDVDDYAVACSSVASNSKLTAAFKKAILKRRDNMDKEAAFGISLVPSPNQTTDPLERIFLSHKGKSHHFAVKTRDERIDWMRELMMAKALKRGKGNGESVRVNGTPV